MHFVFFKKNSLAQILCTTFFFQQNYYMLGNYNYTISEFCCSGIILYIDVTPVAISDDNIVHKVQGSRYIIREGS